MAKHTTEPALFHRAQETGACVPLQVHGPFQMLNIINFLVFRVTRTVLYSLEACMAAPNTAAVVSNSRCQNASPQPERQPHL